MIMGPDGISTTPDPSVCVHIDDLAAEVDEVVSSQQHGGTGLSESFTIHLGVYFSG